MINEVVQFKTGNYYRITSKGPLIDRIVYVKDEDWQRDRIFVDIIKTNNRHDSHHMWLTASILLKYDEVIDLGTSRNSVQLLYG